MGRHFVDVRQLNSEGSSYLNVVSNQYGAIGVWTGAMDYEGAENQNALYKHRSTITFMQFDNALVKAGWEAANPDQIQVWPLPVASKGDQETNADSLQTEVAL